MLNWSYEMQFLTAMNVTLFVFTLFMTCFNVIKGKEIEKKHKLLMESQSRLHESMKEVFNDGQRSTPNG
jgi:hypothetical protein